MFLVTQPVIHREIEKTEIRHVTQPVYQEETVATQIHERTLQPEYRREIKGEVNVLESLQAASAAAQSTLISTTAAAQTRTVVNEAIVHEISMRLSSSPSPRFSSFSPTSPPRFPFERNKPFLAFTSLFP
jgi:hypothetical protein